MAKTGEQLLDGMRRAEERRIKGIVDRWWALSVECQLLLARLLGMNHKALALATPAERALIVLRRAEGLGRLDELDARMRDLG